MGLKLHKLPGYNWLRWPTLTQLEVRDAAPAQFETPKLPYLPQFYFDEYPVDVAPGARELVASWLENESRNRVKVFDTTDWCLS